jgi:hypothetical protein
MRIHSATFSSMSSSIFVVFRVSNHLIDFPPFDFVAIDLGGFFLVVVGIIIIISIITGSSIRR